MTTWSVFTNKIDFMPSEEETLIEFGKSANEKISGRVSWPPREPPMFQLPRRFLGEEGDEEPWHYKRTCAACGHVWGGLHCIHDGYQNPCSQCGTLPVPVPESAEGCNCEFDF